ncbi:uncharacterized protein LOC123527406 isoform X2 [Mercenaria mercenaria]|uniref:uncharacterized protein LOC123527406 isoform X2 n=1 Tax=Mercenaria mercenaria TaxID=6596 RepID=UPI00234EC223|nr:uncharacterized protein LOC123527406 isoform X2 [Mercenaria mercenaria]
MISVMILLAFLPFVESSCQGNGDTLRCAHRWNELGVNIRELTVYKWDGTCMFPAGASVRLFGSPRVDCTSCKYFDNTVTVNGQTCSSDKTTPGQSSATAATWKTSQTVTVRQSTSVTVERTDQDRATSAPMLEACLWTVVILASVYLYNM